MKIPLEGKAPSEDSIGKPEAEKSSPRAEAAMFSVQTECHLYILRASLLYCATGGGGGQMPARLPHSRHKA